MAGADVPKGEGDMNERTKRERSEDEDDYERRDDEDGKRFRGDGDEE